MGYLSPNRSTSTALSVEAPTRRVEDPTRYLPQVEPGRWWGMLWRRGWVVLVTAALAVGGMMAYLAKAPKTYEAYGSVYIATRQPQLLDIEPVTAEESKDLEQMRSVEQSLMSSTLLLKVIEKMELDRAADFAPGATSEVARLGVLRDRIRVELRKGTRLIDLAVQDTNPERAKLLVEAIVSEYEAQAAEVQQEITRQATEGLRTQEKLLQEKSRLSTDKLVKFREANPIPGLDAKNGERPLGDEISALQGHLSEAKAARMKVEAEYEALKKFDPEDPEAMDGLEGSPQAEELAALLRQMREKEEAFATVKLDYLFKHPKFIAAEQDVKRVKEQVAQAARRAGQAVEKAYHLALENEVKLEEAMTKARDAAVQAEGAREEYAKLQADAEADRDLLAVVGKRIRETLIAGAAPATALSWKDRPLTPEAAVKPSRKVLLPLAGAGGLFLGGLLMLGLELGDRKIRGSAGAARATGVPMLATLPAMDEGQRKSMVLLSAPGSAGAEAFRHLRSAMVPGPGVSPRTTLFVSAREGEGRSTCAMNYAAALALQGYRTLLLDADLRSPGLSREYLQPGGERKGLSDYLAGEADPAKACFPTMLSNLYLLSSGAMRPDAAELLAGTRMPALLEEAYRWFDAVVIDTPALLAVSDALPLARYADRTCLVVRRDRSHCEELRKAADFVRSSGGNLIGFVWNESSPERDSERLAAPCVPLCHPVLTTSSVTSAGTAAASPGSEGDSTKPSIA